MLVFEKEAIKRMFSAGAAKLKENVGLLADLDKQFGDGDHGVSMGKVGDAIVRTCDEWADQWDLNGFFDEMGMRLLNAQGGSSGMLWGLWVGGLAIPLAGKEEIDAEALKAMLGGALEETQDMTTAKVGDKTIMDAMLPAFENAMAASETDVAALVRQIAVDARAGAERTREFVAKYGKAKNAGENTVGALDPGAISFALFWEGVASAIDD